MKKLLAVLSLSACVSTKEAPLQNCQELLTTFNPVNCANVPGGLACVNAKDKYVMFTQEQHKASNYAQAKTAGVVPSGYGSQCETPSIGKLDVSFWSIPQSLTEKAPHLEHKTL